MSIKKTISGTYQVRVYLGTSVSGKSIIKTATFKTYNEAQKEHARIKRKIAGASALLPENITLENFYRTIFIDHVKPRVRQSTWRSYESVIYNHVLPEFGKVKLQDITRASIQSCIQKKDSYQKAKRTVELLRLILSVAQDHLYIESNAAIGRFIYPRKKKKPDGYKGAVLQDFSQHKQIIERLDYDEVGLFIVLGLSTGMRKGEILALRRSDINLKDAEISITKTYTERASHVLLPKTFESERVVGVPRWAWSWLVSYFENNNVGITQYLFKGNKENLPLHPYTIAKKMAAFFDDNKDLPRLTAFSLRHSFATSAINAGVPVEHVSKTLGHTSVITTYNSYVRVDDQKAKEHMSRINDAFK